MKLSDEEIAFVSAEIDKSNISMQELKDDLLDHFCCFIEHERKKGLSFAEAYNKAKAQVCPDGFADLRS
ncbi:MAG: hypothetical protein ACO1OF_04970 [Adhaeribacter sp.]